jgi:hypothetical protein
MAGRGAYPPVTSAFTAPGSGAWIFQIPYFKATHIHYKSFSDNYSKKTGGAQWCKLKKTLTGADFLRLGIPGAATGGA